MTTELASEVIARLSGKTLATAESITGGGIGAALTAVSGSSAVYKGGVISYTNGVKEHILGVPGELLESCGAVSAPVARAMAEGVKKLLSADVLCRRDESGGLCVEYVCDSCGKAQSGSFHYLSCGHYSCDEGFDPAGHGIAECQTAGHCMSQQGHDRCSNCQQFVCNGQAHGSGLCQHEHNWVATSLISSRCVSCGYVYTRK